MPSYLDVVNQKVVVFDGATGTNLQEVGLTADDFGGPDLEGCNEYLVVTRPDVIRDLHTSLLDVGVDVIETDTLGSFAIPLGEYGLAELDLCAAMSLSGRAHQPPPTVHVGLYRLVQDRGVQGLDLAPLAGRAPRAHGDRLSATAALAG
jgi:hypothetical protein